MITLYGIPNCDTVKKARSWLDAHGLSYTFHDFKKSGLSNSQIQTWLHDVAWDVLVNRKGTTWRALSDERKTAILDAKSATSLMIESPSIIKRPVLVTDNKTYVGFSDELYQQIFKK
ncbi:MAG: ArsC family reductase [Burkholderiaceae bacterium]